MSLERVVRAVMGLGLSEFDAQVYVFLALNGPQTAKQIADSMKRGEQQVYRSLRSLKENNVAVASGEVPAVFSAACFEKVLDLLSIKKAGQAKALEKVKADLLDSWQKIIENNSANVPRIINGKIRKEKMTGC